MTQQQKGGLTTVHSKLNITYIAYESTATSGLNAE